MVNAVSRTNPYGNIQRLSQGSDGRVVYRVIDSEGKEAGKMSIAKEDVDTFEKSYIDIMSTAPKIHDYVEKNSKPEDLKRRKNLSRLAIGACGCIGAAAPLLLMRNAGTTKKILSSVAGIVAGLLTGFGISLSITTPPGAFKFAKATRNLSKIDIQPVEDSTMLQATRM